MNLEKFRIYHSTLIEHYQFIEAHLEGIYAALSGKSLSAGLQDVEKCSLHRLLKEIKELERDKKQSVFTDEEYKRMEKIFQRRNFWCHNCYYDMLFDKKTGGPKKDEDIKAMVSDLHEAAELRDELFEKYEEQSLSSRTSNPAFIPTI